MIAICVIMLLIAGGIFYKVNIDNDLVSQEEKNEISQSYNGLRNCLLRRDIDGAMKYFSPNFFAEGYGKEDISNVFKILTNSEYALHPHYGLAISGDTAEFCPANMSSSLNAVGWMGFKLIKINGKWYFTGETITYTN